MNLAARRLAGARLRANPRTWGYVTVLFTIVAVVSVATRQRGSIHAADGVLVGTVAGLALPILSFGIVSALFDGKGARQTVAFLSTFGGKARDVFVPFVAIAAFTSAVLSAALATLAMTVASRFGTSASDLAVTALVAATGGATYATVYAWASTFGDRGEGRFIALFADWILGAGTGVLALPAPRAHLRALMGEAAPLHLSPRISFVALMVIAAAFTAFGIRRADSIRSR